MDEHDTRRSVASWFIIAAIASLLFMALGCIALTMHFTADPAKLPLDQLTLFEAEPTWVVAASAVGFICGAIGTLLLVLRRAAAVQLLLVSFLGFFVWLAGMLLTPRFRDLLSTDEIAIVLIVVAVAWTIYWFARHSRQRGWLR